MLSVVIPAYNEEARVGRTIDATTAWLDERGEDYEMLVVDDGSKDGTGNVVDGIARRNPRVRRITLPKNRGKGAAVREGILLSRGHEVLFCDADLATPVEELTNLRAALAQGADIAIGSRALPGSRIDIRQHPARETMGRIFNVIVRTAILGGLRDTQCGFKLFRGDVARELFAQATVDGFAFDVEVLLLAQPRYKVAEVPVTWRHVEQSKVSPGLDAAKMFVDVVRLKIKHARRRKP